MGALKQLKFVSLSQTAGMLASMTNSNPHPPNPTLSTHTQCQFYYIISGQYSATFPSLCLCLSAISASPDFTTSLNHFSRYNKTSKKRVQAQEGGGAFPSPPLQTGINLAEKTAHF